MESGEKYKNLASSDHPATVIYLVDISNSMGARMPDGRTRIDMVKDAIQTSYGQLIGRSMRQGVVHPRYRVGMIAYSNDLYDIYEASGSIITIDKLKDEGVPPIAPQQGTEMAKAFRYTIKLIQDDIKSWSQQWLNECPPPMVINITDCENSKEADDPLEYAQKLKAISVPDGNVIVQNIFINDTVTLSTEKIKDWTGYSFNETTGDVYGDKLLAMSSPLPSRYAQSMREQSGVKIREGTAMMFPGVFREFIKTSLVMSVVTGAQIKQLPSRPLSLDSNDQKASKVLGQTGEFEKSERKVEKGFVWEKYRISISYSERLSKRFESTFLFQFYSPDYRTLVDANIKSEFSKLRPLETANPFSNVVHGERVRIEFYSPKFTFSQPITKTISGPIIKTTFLGMPNDNCEPGLHKVRASVTDPKSGDEIDSLTVGVQVADFAFDHISRPFLSRIFSAILGLGSLIVFILTFLQQIDKTVGLTSGTAAGVLAAVLYTNFYNLYKRTRLTVQ